MNSVSSSVPALTAPALDMRRVRVLRGRREVLRLAELQVAVGETLAVLGANGAGKSTLLLTAALLLDPAEGDVQLFGRRPSEVGRTTLRRETATVFQDAALLDMSARDNVETALGLHGVPRAARRDRAMHWLERLGVAHLHASRPHTLSGGEAQRVSLARAFAVQPRLLFLDEPFASLDYATRATLVGEVRTLLATEGVTALIATHDHSEAELLAQRALVLVDGVAAQLGPVDDIFRYPASLAVAHFLGYSALPAALLARLLGVEQQATWGLVPPRSAVVISDSAAHEGTGLVAGVVTAVQGALGHGRILVDVGAPLAAEVAVSEIRTLELRPGSPVRLRIDPERIAWL